MTLASGTRLGPYEIVAKLGEGGMGEVYKARDTRLGRTVAVKVLSARLVSDPDVRARFEREARAISSLSHPHVCALFDVGQEGPIDYLVMELIEGETLAHRIVKGPLPLADTLRFGGQIAAALDKAHRLGIVHRDLKPGNVMLTSSGVKLLDFGLAKLHTAPAPNLSRSTVAVLPTVVAPAGPLTVEGSLVGTPQYMAPEQLEGHEIDTRADLWALGCVLYEMATARKAFPGESQASLIAAVLGPGPGPASRVTASTPPALDQLIQSCLAKDPEHRWQSAHDAALELAAIAAGAGADGAASPPVRRRRALAFAALAALAVGAAVPLGIWLGRRNQPSTTAPEVRFPISPPPGTMFPFSVEDDYLALSPDGLALAFVVSDASRVASIWVRSVDQLDARQLAGTDGARSLTWSPDGKSIAFIAGGRLKRIDLAGGAAVPICDVAQQMGFSVSWGAAGQILFASVQGEAIYRVSATGGPIETVLRPDPARQEVRASWPLYLADGKGFLYLRRNADMHSSLMQAEPGQPPREVAPLDSRVDRASGDWLVFAREGALLAQRFDRAAGRLIGAPSSVAPAVRYFMSSSWSGFTASPTGSIFYLSQVDSSRLTWFDRTGKAVGTVGPPGNYLGLSLSADGRALLADRGQPEFGTYDIWQTDLERGIETRLTSSPDADFGPVWLPDSKSMVYSAPRGRAPNLVRRDLVTGQERMLLERSTFQDASDASHDGSLFAFLERGNEGKFHAWTLHLDGEPRAQRLFATDAEEREVRFSADGRFVAYLSDDSGGKEAYVSPLASPAERTRISPQGATAVHWSRDGKEIFLVNRAGDMLAVPVRTTPTLEIGTPARLFSIANPTAWGNFDVTPDGRRFLVIVRERPGGAQPGTALLNWKPGRTG